MPIYEYTCNDCKSEFEVLIRGDEKPSCPSCGKGRLTRSISVTAAHVAGTRDPQCPAKSSCDMKHCMGEGCGMGQFG